MDQNRGEYLNLNLMWFDGKFYQIKSFKDYNFKVCPERERQRMEPLENFEKVIKRKDLLRFQDERGKKMKNHFTEAFCV